MSHLDKILLGTRWTRVIGTHSPSAGIIDDVSPKGPRIKVVQHNGRATFIRPYWDEIGVGWKPADSKSQHQFDLWSVSVVVEKPEVLVTTDKEGFVVETKREPSEYTIAPSPMLPCSGAWHLKNGAPTMLPQHHFSRIDRGARNGEWAKTCNDCRKRQRDSQKISREKSVVANQPISQNGTVSTPVAQNLNKWVVTIIRETQVVVEATDFLDAGAKAGEGEIVKVERLPR